jgi:hypothetical protein
MSDDPERVKRNVMSSFWTKYNYINQLFMILISLRLNYNLEKKLLTMFNEVSIDLCQRDFWFLIVKQVK